MSQAEPTESSEIIPTIFLCADDSTEPVLLLSTSPVLTTNPHPNYN